MNPPADPVSIAGLLEDAPSIIDPTASPSSAVLQMILSTATSAAMAAVSTSTSSPSASIYEESEGECQLLGSFALVVQGALGALALLALVFKRWRERPQRPLKVWAFDASKQVFGSVLVHIANIFMSMLTSGRFSVQVAPGAVPVKRDDDDYTPNPCSFYLLNLAIDVSCPTQTCQ